MATKVRVQLLHDEEYAMAKEKKDSRGLRLMLQRIRSDSLLRNSIFIMGSTVVTSVVGYMYWVLAAHTYSAYNIGLASAFISAMSLTSTFASLGIGSALIQLLPRREAGHEWSITLNACMLAGIFTSLVGGVIVAIALPFLSPQFATGKSHLLYLLCFIVGVVLCTVTTLLDQTFVAERATGNMATRNAVFALLKLPLMLLLVQIGALGIFSSWVLSLGATLIFGMLVLIPRLKRNYRLDTHGLTKQIRPMLPAFAGHHFINIGGSLPMYLLPVFVAVKLSATDNAYFYTTWMLGSLFFMVSASVATALFSEGSHTVSDLIRKVRNSVLFIVILLCPVLLVFFFEGNVILSIFGKSYAQHGILLLIILMISSVPDAITNIYVSLLRVQKRLRSAALLNLGMAILALILAWILLPILGIAGAGWAWLIAQSGGSLVVGIDVLRSRSAISTLHKESSGESVPRRLTLRNLVGFWRYCVLRLRFRKLRVGLFFIDRGGQIDIGPDARVHFGRGIRFMRDFTGHFYGEVTVGNNVFFNRSCYVAVYSRLIIGNYCLFGEGVSIHDENHVIGVGPEPIASRGFVMKPVTIGNNVWVGAKATILSGTTIGDNAVVGANAVVTHDVPANTIVGGIPARVLRAIEPSVASSKQMYDDTTNNIEQNHEDMASIWLVDTIKQLSVQLPLKGQYYGEIESSVSGHGLHLPPRSIEVTANKPVMSSSENSPSFKKIRLQEDISSEENNSTV
jgi:acetyltransferase-like isoleucine patch superfamily enzyme/O-antigen/teichoic acid export membrane protein